MEPKKLPRDGDKPGKQYTSLPLLTGASTRDASFPTDSGLGSVNPLENCVCKDNLKKYATLPMIGIALLLLTNTAITITQHQGGTSVNFCRNFTLPIDVFTPATTPFCGGEKEQRNDQVPRAGQKLSGAKLVSSGRGYIRQRVQAPRQCASGHSTVHRSVSGALTYRAWHFSLPRTVERL